MKKTLSSRRVRFVTGLVWVMLFALAGHLIPNATASLHSAAAVGSNPLTTKALIPPGNLKSAWNRNDVILTWTAGAGGGGYVILGSVSITSNCTSAHWQQIARVGGHAVTSYVDAGRVITKGQWYCYQVETSMADWTSSANPTTAIQQRRAVEVTKATPTPVSIVLAPDLQIATHTGRPTMSKPPAISGKPTSERATALPSKARPAILKITGTAIRTSPLTTSPADLPSATATGKASAAVPTLAATTTPDPSEGQATLSVSASGTPVTPTIVNGTPSK